MIVVAMGILYGLLAAWIYRKTTHPRRIRAAMDHLLAHIMEFRLFVDEPALIWRAQRDALRANLALLREIAVPTALMAALFAMLWFPIDARFGHRPLKAGESAVITSNKDEAPNVPGVAVETPGVRIARTGEVSWRIRPVREIDGGFPPGYEVRWPRTESWLLWFFLSSCGGALAVGAWHAIL